MNPNEPSQEKDLTQQSLNEQISLANATDSSEQTHDWTPLQLGFRLYRWSILIEMGLTLVYAIFLVLIRLDIESEWFYTCYQYAIQFHGIPTIIQICYWISVCFLCRQRATELSYQLIMAAVVFFGIVLVGQLLFLMQNLSSSIKTLVNQIQFSYSMLVCVSIGDCCLWLGVYCWGRFLFQKYIERLALILLISNLGYTFLSFTFEDISAWLNSPEAAFMSESFRYILVILLLCVSFLCLFIKWIFSYLIFKRLAYFQRFQFDEPAETEPARTKLQS